MAQELCCKEQAKCIAKLIFDKYDQNKDGFITSEEIPTLIDDIYKSMTKVYIPNKKDIESMIQILDKNKDGRVNYQDIENLTIDILIGGNRNYRNMIEDDQLEQLRWAFNQIDKSGKGEISREQVQGLIKILYNYEPSEFDINDFMMRVDIDQDNYINLWDLTYELKKRLRDQGMI